MRERRVGEHERLRADGEDDAAVLRLHLRLGAPRIAQLLRLLRADIQPDSLTLWDGKGRPGSNPRAHMLPLDAQACRRRSKSEPPCRSNIEPGAQASFLIAGCG